MSRDEAFAERYEEWSASITAVVPFYVDLARSADEPLVELAIGNGRVAIPVAQVTGQRVIGIDSSPAMLAQTRARAAEAGVDLECSKGRARPHTLVEPAGLIYCPSAPSCICQPGRTAAAPLNVSPRLSVEVAAFLWNAFAFDHHIAARLDGKARVAPVPHTVLYAAGDSRIDIVLEHGGRSSLWWATKNEWLALIDVAGLQLEPLYGGFQREPFGDESRDYVFVCHR